jgi:hypothetical protein
MVVIALLSIVLTKFVVDLSLSGDGDRSGYQNVTMTDAYLKCIERVSRVYGEDLYSYSMDDLSTRFDQQNKLFMVFMDVEVVSGPEKAAESSFVSCKVSAAGVISDFDITVESGSSGGGGRRSKGNPFGFDLKR